MRLLIDLRWIRSEVLDGIARVSLSVTSELLRLYPDWRFGLLFATPRLRDFALNWIQTYHGFDIVADYVSLVTGFSAQSPLNRALLWKQVKGFRPDLYYSFYYIFHPLPVPQVATVHDLTPLLYPEYFSQASLGFRLTMTQTRVLNHLLSSMDGVVTVSQNTRQDLIQRLGLEPERIHVCPPGVDPPEAAKGKAPLKGQLAGLRPGYVLSLGRPDPHKNFQGLIEAFGDLSPELRRQHPLILAGPEHRSYTRQLESRIRKLGLDNCVYLLGPVSNEDLPALYQHAALFALVSYYEGFGLPVLEAMAQGTPVLTSDRSSLPEVAGDAALLVNPERSMEISWALNRLLKVEHVANTLRKRGLARAESFSWQQTAERLSLALRQVLTGANLEA